MTTAIEAMEQATTKPEDAQKPAEGEQKPAEGGEAAVSTPSFEDVTKQVKEIEDAAAAGDVKRLREQNEELTLKQFPEEMRPGVQKVLDLQKEGQYIRTEREKLDTEKLGMARVRILAEFKEDGVTEAHLKHCPDEAAMKEMAESIKALKGGGEGEGGEGGEGGQKPTAKPNANPNAMNEKPSGSTAGAAGGTKPAVERFARKGVEAGITGLLGDWQRGEE